MTDLDELIHDLLATDNIALMDDAAAALTRLRDRVTELEALVRDAEEEVTCRLDDAACYCPNCDRSMFNVRDRLRAALKGATNV